MRKLTTGTLLGACFACFLWAFLAVPASAANVALTFDDGPGRLTGELLELLAEEEVPATFFLCGYRLDEYPEAAALLSSTEHELGVHGYTHTPMSRLTPDALRQEMADTALRIIDTIGREPTVMRPPGGLCCDCVCDVSRSAGYPVILWTVDPEDWRQEASGDAVCRKILAEAADGDIILLHDLNRCTLEALPAVIRTLKARGFTFHTVSGLAAVQQTVLEPGRCYSSFPAADSP